MTTDNSLNTVPLKFASGQALTRKEDLALLRGEGRYTDDVQLDGEVHGMVLRSPYGHARILGLDVDAARSAPGVLAVYTIADLKAAGYGAFPFPLPLKNHDGSDPTFPDRFALADDRVRHVGEPVAFVVAETLAEAHDAVELIDLDVEMLDALNSAEAALAEGAPRLYDDHDNLCMDWRTGDRQAVDAAFADAAHITSLRIPINRVAVVSMESRAAIAQYDAASEQFTLHTGSQGVWGMRQTLASAVLKIEPEKLRVISLNVGGSFGMKSQQYAEPVLVLHAARELGRPVRWRDDRSGSFTSDFQGRDLVSHAELALDENGKFLAVRLDGYSDVGGYSTALAPMMHSINIMKNTPSLYDTPLFYIRTRTAFTNKVPMAPYRGAGRPEGNYIMERLVEQAARETGRDRVDLRRLNLIKPDALPYTATSGLTYDSGDFPAVLDKSLAAADWDGYEARKAVSTSKGLLRGRGLACYLEVTAPPAKEMGGIRFGDDGRVSIISGTHDHGQGHHTTFAEVMRQLLNVPADKIDLIQSDSDELIGGGGTGGSKSLVSTGVALMAAADVVIEKGRHWAGHVLEAAAEDIEFATGEFRVAGTDKSIPLLDLARLAANSDNRPDNLSDGLDTELLADTPPSTFPNGCHVCEIEIDPETGSLRIDSYSAVDDFGTVINPMIVEGQVHGGIVQGIGQILMEDTHYDEDGQLRSGTFMDYAMPRADDLPSFSYAEHPSPATTNPLGAKGCGEAGTSGAMACMTSAILDALAPLGVAEVAMPATPLAIWQAIQDAR
jgi:carbon-monoxide dehydrogenase large subunit